MQIPEQAKMFHTVFMTLHGSRLYGMDTEDSDYDYIGAAVEPPEYVIAGKNYCNTNRPFEQHEWKADNAEGTTYSLRKLVKLFTSSNPTILCTMFSPDAHDPLGITQEWFRDLVRTSKAVKPFYGYMSDQLKRLDRGSGLHVVRQDLIDTYGYDTKYSSNIIRLGYQAIEYLSTGYITLPMPEDQLDYVMGVRNGSISKLEFLKVAGVLLAKVDEAGEKSILPPHPQYEKLQKWLVQTYFWEWSE